MRTSRGFSVVELLVVLFLMAILLGWAAQTFRGYQARHSARRAAEIFAQDLNVTKNAALRSRSLAILDFDETELGYLVRVESGDTILRRSFGDGGEIELTSLDLEMPGDSLAFDGRGKARLTGGRESLGRAVFTVADRVYSVYFNSMGVARIDESG